MFNMLTKYRFYALITLLFLAGLMGYAIHRAFHLSLTHDEALTYIYFAWLPKSYAELITYQIPTTNNHLLNSILIKFLTSRLGNSELIIRIPALLGYFLYLIASYQILRKLFDNWKLILGFTLLVAHPFLIDYFTCARGYGLGLGLMMLGIYWNSCVMLCLAQKKSIRSFTVYALLACAMLSLATFANLIFLNVLLASCIVLIASPLFFCPPNTHKKTRLLSALAGIFVSLSCVSVTALVYLKPIQKLRKANEFYHGGNLSFWIDSVQSLIKATLHEKFLGSSLPILLLSILIVVVLIFSAFRVLRRSADPTSEIKLNQKIILFIVFWTIVLCWIGIEVQHWLLKNVFPFDRGVIYFIPLFSLLIISFFPDSRPETRGLLSKFCNRALIFICIILCVHYISCMNTTHFLLNKPDAHTKEMMQDLEELNRGKPIAPQSKKFGIHWWFEPAINYYVLRNKLPWFGFVTREGFDGAYDYYYFREEDKWVIQKYNLKILKQYPISKTYLAVPNNS